MDAFSALTTNLAPTAPSSAPTSSSVSPSNNESFATHLQSASNQQSTGQRTENPKTKGKPQAQQNPTDQAADVPTTQPAASQTEPLPRDPMQADVERNASTPDPTAATESIASAQAPLPPQISQSQVAGQAVAETQTSTVVRMLDALALPTPATINGAPGGQTSPTDTVPTTKAGTATETGSQQIIVESATNTPAVASPTEPLAATAETVPISPLSSLQSTNTLPQPLSQPTGVQSSVANQDTTIVFQPATQSLSTTTAPDGATSMPPTADEPGAPLIVQNQYSQIITIQQNNALPVAPESQGTTTVAPLINQSDADMDLTNQYIHSHLPNETATKGEDAGHHSNTNNESGQSTPNNQMPQAAESQSTAEALFTAKNLATAGQESQPLIFSHQQGSGLTSATLTTSTTSTAAPDSSLYRLSSGTTVPDGTVVDQMIAHFSINKRLETGSVNLRLHPQELGELRMEITVEQDNVKAHIVTQSPHAQEMIDRHLPKLREALERQGLHLGQVEVTVASNDNAAGERFQEQATRQQSHRSMGVKQNHSLFELDLDEELPITTTEVDNNLSVIA
jgi:flagellar hook-length control protein FliK